MMSILHTLILCTLLATGHGSLIESNSIHQNREPSIDTPSNDPLSTTNRSTRRLLKNKSVYIKPEIVHGSIADKGQFPYAGYLSVSDCTNDARKAERPVKGKIQRDDLEGGVCASSLIMPRVIVTAGHCPAKCNSSPSTLALPRETPSIFNTNYNWSTPTTVKLNRWDVSQSNESGGESKTISTIVRHPLFLVDSEGNPAQNDISLMSFDRPSTVTPIRLASTANFSTGQLFQVAGWGYTDPFRNSLSNVLRTATVPYVANDQCSSVYGFKIWGGDICAGADPSNYADTCQGDSGGPLLLNGTSPDPSNHILAGLTSYGYSCANKHPGIYTNIALQRPWIDDTITLHNMGGDSPPLAQCSPYQGQIYQNPVNTTIRNVVSAGECCNACKVQKVCGAWAWNAVAKVCTVMGSVVSRGVNSGFTSGNVTIVAAPTTMKKRSAPKKPSIRTRDSVSECQLEYYVQYSAQRGSQRLLKGLPVQANAATPSVCCSTCQANAACLHFTWNKKNQQCVFYSGPSKLKGWGRKPWQYDYVSGLVVRK